MAKPLERFIELSSSNVDEVHAGLSNRFSHHKLHIPEPGTICTRLSMARLSEISVGYLELGTSARVEPERSEYYVAHVPISGSLRISRNDEDMVTGCGDVMVTSPFDRSVIDYGPGTGVLFLRVARSELEHRLSRLLDAPLTDPLGFYEYVSVGDKGLGTAWNRQFMFIVNELNFNENAGSLFDACGRELEHALLNSLLFAQKHNYSHLLSNGYAQIVPYYVKAAIQFIIRNADEPISLTDIVASSGISKRALYFGFNKFRCTTPMLYLQQIRLMNVRKDILAATPADNVTRIAMRRGFTQMGRFSALFKAAYGISPSQLLRAALSQNSEHCQVNSRW